MPIYSHTCMHNSFLVSLCIGLFCFILMYVAISTTLFQYFKS
jgi:hypothetical protein